MKSPKRLSGIYDLRTLNFLIENGIHQFIFDFRPTSMSFLQEYKVVELLKGLSFGKVFLLFRNEKTFMMERIYNSCRNSFGGELILEVEGSVDDDFSQLGVPFYYRIEEEEQLSSSKSIFLNQNCRGHVLSYEMLKNLNDRNSFMSWVQRYYQEIGGRSLELKQDLYLDWDSDIFPTLFEYFDFDSLTLPVNSKIEVCYRNVDLNKVSTNLKHLNFTA